MRYRHALVAALLSAGLLAGCGVGSDVTAGEGGANTVNGSITVPPGMHSGAVGTVNGSIHVGDNAVVAGGNTVNGSISLGAHASSASLNTVNGSVKLAEGVRVDGGVNTVNGSVKLASGAEVTGGLSNVNGQIALNDAHVGGGLHTVDGDISVLGNSHVEGGILMKKNQSWFNWNSHTPRVVIGPGAVVQGDLRFERAVQLYVSDKATIGPVIGATAQRFTGDSPPP
jgi:hypothetical protein